MVDFVQGVEKLSRSDINRRDLYRKRNPYTCKICGLRYTTENVAKACEAKCKVENEYYTAMFLYAVFALSVLLGMVFYHATH